MGFETFPLLNILFSPPSIVHGDFGFLRFLSKRRIKAYPNKADNTRKIQTTRYRSTAFSWVEMGALSLTLLKIFMRTRKRVTRSAIRPGTTSGLIRNDTHDTTTNIPEGR